MDRQRSSLPCGRTIPWRLVSASRGDRAMAFIESERAKSRSALWVHVVIASVLVLGLVQSLVSDFVARDTVSMIIVRAAPVWGAAVCIGGALIGQVWHVASQRRTALLLVAICVLAFGL